MSNSTLDRISFQLAKQHCDKKDSLIVDAISHVLGNEWKIESVKDRAQIKILPDRTQVFCFDGVDMIHFLHTRLENHDNNLSMTMTAVTEYKLLY